MAGTCEKYKAARHLSTTKRTAGLYQIAPVATTAIGDPKSSNS